MPGQRGNKGGGRKSAYQEKIDANFLVDLFLHPMDKTEVTKLLASGKYSIKDVWVSKMYAGNERLIDSLIDRLFPKGLVIDNPGQTEQNEKLRNILKEMIKNVQRKK